MKEPLWGLQQSPKVVSGAGPPSLLSFSPPGDNFGCCELWRELGKLFMSGLWVPHGEGVYGWVRPCQCLWRPGLRPGCCPALMVERGGPEAPLVPEGHQLPPNRGPAQQGAQPGPRGEPGTESSWVPLCPTYYHGLGAVRAPLRCPGPPALCGVSFAAFRKVRAHGKAACPAAGEHTVGTGLCLAGGKGSTSDLGQQSLAAWGLRAAETSLCPTCWKSCLSVKVMSCGAEHAFKGEADGRGNAHGRATSAFLSVLGQVNGIRPIISYNPIAHFAWFLWPVSSIPLPLGSFLNIYPSDQSYDPAVAMWYSFSCANQLSLGPWPLSSYFRKNLYTVPGKGCSVPRI